jgi:flagellar motor protein MotB
MACAPTVDMAVHTAAVQSAQATAESTLRARSRSLRRLEVEDAEARARAAHELEDADERIRPVLRALQERRLERDRSTAEAPITPALRRLLAALPPGWRGVRTLSIDGRPALRLPSDALFARGSARLRPGVDAALARLAAAVPPEARLELAVHCDGEVTPRAAEAIGLTGRQGLALHAALVAAGLAPERLEIAAHGNLRPVELDPRDEAQIQNRRIELVLR